MANRQPNQQLAAAMAEAGMSNKGLARRMVNLGANRGQALGTTHIAVKRWLDGSGIASETVRVMAEVFSSKLGRVVTPRDLGFPEIADGPATDQQSGWVGLVSTLRADAEQLPYDAPVSDDALVSAALSWMVDRAPDTPPAAGSQRVRMRDVLAIRTAADMFMQLDFLFGGGHGRRALRHYVRHEALPLLDGTFTDEIGHALYDAVGDVTQLLGWTAYDTGDHSLARRYFLGTLQLARAVDDRTTGSRLLANMSHQANYLGQHSLALHLARAAREGARGRATPRAMSMFTVHEARALANLGDEFGATRALREAEQYMSRASGYEDPTWLSYFDESELLGEFAHCFRDLRRPEPAIEYATEAVARADPGYARTLAFCRMVLAESQRQQGSLEESLATATLAVSNAEPLQSARVVRYVEDYQRELPQTAREVDDFHQTVARTLENLDNV
jgi:tetratricopeptide (TPR) repeat protein